jgi:predicted dinucleotide-binding enzyme
MVRARKEDGVKITTIGRGNVGGGLTKLWSPKGHDVIGGPRAARALEDHLAL